MSKLDELIEFGRNMKTVSSKKGALVLLKREGAYLINDRHTVAFVFASDLGTGCFYAEEAPKGTQEVKSRGEKTLFATKSKGIKRHIFVPTKQEFDDELNETFVTYWAEPLVTLPPQVFSAIDPAILVTSLSFYQNKIIVTQKRTDGVVELESIIDLNYGFVTQEVEDSNIITIYTNDFLLLNSFKNPKISIISNDHPLMIRGTLKAMPVRGLIAYHKFEA